MDRLIEGYHRFRAETWPAQRARYQALSAHGQKPETLIVSCSDSRVDPATVFGAAPGELFVVRNVAALVPPYQPDGGCHGTSAALEYGVRVLGVRQIVVLGHGQCGGVQAMIQGVPEEARDFVAPWVSDAATVVRGCLCDRDGPDRQSQAEAAMVRLSLANLLSFPWIADRAARGSLALHGMTFAIHTGLLQRVGPDGVRPVDQGGASSP